jgi:SAM-dependent methyltransferase
MSTRINETAYGERDTSLQYFVNNRNSLSSLYKSERHFLEPAFKNVKSVLDIGCAAGGGYDFSLEANPNIKYSGIDICDKFVSLAKHSHPDGEFLSFDGHNIPYKSDAFEMSFSIGVCHHILHWQKMINEMLRVSSRYVVFDLRLTYSASIFDPEIYFQKIAFDEKWDGKTKIPYLVINVNEVKCFFNKISKNNCRIEAVGYKAKPTELSVIPYDEVLMVSFLIVKDSIEPGVFINIED